MAGWHEAFSSHYIESTPNSIQLRELVAVKPNKTSV